MHNQKYTQLDNAESIDIVMAMHNSIEYSNSYSETSRSLWQDYRDEPVLEHNNNITDFPANNSNGISFKFKQQMTEETVAQKM